MKLYKLAIMGSAVMLSACGSDNDDDPIETPVEPTFTATTTYNIDLNGMQSVPMTGSMQMATATVEVDENLMQIRASVDISGVDGVTAVHIHDGDIGMNGDVAFGFEMDGDDAYTLAETDVTSELIEDLADGDWYINVHTETFENGEVRGQIISDDMAIVTFEMSENRRYQRYLPWPTVTVMPWFQPPPTTLIWSFIPKI